MDAKTELKPILPENDQKDYTSETYPPSSQDSNDVPAKELESKNDLPKNTGCIPKIHWSKTKCAQLGIALGGVVSGIVWVISLPACVTGLFRVKSDAYITLLAPFWAMVVCLLVAIPLKCIPKYEFDVVPTRVTSTILIALANVSANLLQAYSALPERTPQYLQVILSMLVIPFTVLAKFLILRKGVSRNQMVCIGVVMIGLVISMIPQFLSVKVSDEELVGNRTETMEEYRHDTHSVASRVLWPICFGLSFLPFGICCVLIEKYVNEAENVNPVMFCFYTQLWSFILGIALFWTDLIPEFGMAKSIEEFWHHLVKGLQCSFTYSSGCDSLLSRWWIFILAYSTTYLFQFLLISYTHGAIYSVLVLSMVLPVGTIFWTLFSDDNFLFWDPKFTVQTAFGIGSLFILLPAVAMYDYYSVTKQKREEKGFEELKE